MGSSFAAVPPTASRLRRFAPTEHLAPEAVAAFVDGELGSTAQQRALDHVARCPECAEEVSAQSIARSSLRACCNDVHIPESLLGQLSEIPARETPTGEFDLPEPGSAPRRRNRFRGR